MRTEYQRLIHPSVQSLFLFFLHLFPGRRLNCFNLLLPPVKHHGLPFLRSFVRNDWVHPSCSTVISFPREPSFLIIYFHHLLFTIWKLTFEWMLCISQPWNRSLRLGASVHTPHPPTLLPFCLSCIVTLSHVFICLLYQEKVEWKNILI